jgi:hypothetical protein
MPNQEKKAQLGSSKQLSVSLFRKGKFGTELGHIGVLGPNQSMQEVEDLDQKSFRSN